MTGMGINDKKKNKLYREWFWGSQYDVEAMREHFEQMAAKGLMLKEIKGVMYCYERCEPKKVRFCVDCFDKATSFDTKAEPETLEYIEYCEKAGWHYVCTNGRLQYFCSEDSEAVPIQTDNKTAFKSLVRNTLKANAVGWFVLPLIYIFTIAMWLFRNNYYSFVDMVANGVWHSVFFMYIVYTVIALVGITRFLIFYFRNRKRVSDEKKPWYYSARAAKCYGRLVAAVSVTGLLIMTAGIVYSASSLRMVYISAGMFAAAALIIFIVIKATASPKATRAKNIVLTVVLSVTSVYLILIIMTLANVFSGRFSGTVTKNGETYRYRSDKLPITMEELGVGAKEGEYLYEETYSDVSRGLFASLHEYGDSYMKEDGLALFEYSIDVFRTKNGRIKSRYEEELTKFGDGVLTEIVYDGAGECTVYKIGADPYRLYLRFEGCQVLIDCSWEISGRQLEQLIDAYGF